MTRVAVLYNDDAALARGAPDEALAVQSVVDAARAIAGALASRGHEVSMIGVEPEPRAALALVAGLRCDVVFNLVEAIGGDARKEQAFAWLCELCGLAYTGSGPRAMTLCLDKPVASAVLAARGLPVPRSAVLARGDEAVTGLRYPLLVKPSREDASHGVSRDSVVHTRAALAAQATRVVATYAQPALAEEYIDGREINVALLARGGAIEILPLSEIDYAGVAEGEPRILTYEGKWIASSPAYAATKVIPARDLGPAGRARVEAVARGAFDVLGLSGYGRVDLRLDRDGAPHIIDVNPNPDLSPGAGFHLAAERASMSHADVLVAIVESALARAPS